MNTRGWATRGVLFCTLLLLISNPSVFASSPGPSKLQHLIFIIQENHSFDNYFGTYPGANGLGNAVACCRTPTYSMVGPYHLSDAVLLDQITFSDEDLPFQITEWTNVSLLHSWQAAFTDWDYGKMDGFIIGENNTQTMGYYDRSDIPYYWDYADNFVLDDNFFSSMMGPSLPNHLYIASGSAGNGALANPYNYTWIVNGTIIGQDPAFGPDYQIFSNLSLGWAAMAQELSQRHVSWKWYTGAEYPTALSLWDVLPAFSYFQQHPLLIEQNVVGTQNFVNSVQNGSLPSVSWIIPGSAWTPPVYPFTDQALLNDLAGNCVTAEHPPDRSDCGMDYVSYLINTVMKSSYWNSTAIVVTWDDYGGFYDHVPPPQVSGDVEGFRVPTLVISPFAKHGYVDHTPYEFGSMLSLIETVFNLPSLGASDSTGIGRNNMMNAFDFNQPPQPTLIEPDGFLGPADTNPPPNGNPSPNYGDLASILTIGAVVGIATAVFVKYWKGRRSGEIVTNMEDVSSHAVSG